MKKFLISITFLFAFTANAFAQDASATSTATANVLSQLTINSGGPLDFGDVSAVTIPEILPTDASAVQFDVSGQTDETFFVQFPSAFTIFNTETTPQELQLNVALNGAQTTSQGSSAAVASGDEITLTDGNYFFWFGGSITDTDGTSAIPNTKLGAFSGDFTIEIGYSTF